MQINVNVPDGKSNDWEVSSFEVTKDEASLHNLRVSLKPGCRFIRPGEYKRLTRNGRTVMSNTPSEISDHLQFIFQTISSKGHILINGLGLGVALTAILENDVKSVTVIEKSSDVIALVGPTFEQDKRVNIIHADAFTWKPPKGRRYDAVWHDIWDDVCSGNLPEMTRLHRKYGRRTDWQSSWCKGLCKRML